MICLRKSPSNFSVCWIRLNRVMSSTTTTITMRLWLIISPMSVRVTLLRGTGSSTTWSMNSTHITRVGAHRILSASMSHPFITETPHWTMSGGSTMTGRISLSHKSSWKGPLSLENLIIKDSLLTALIRNLLIAKGMAGATVVPTPSMLIRTYSTL